jgi:hypothetical protein
MQLDTQDVERFYAIWKPLILFVNRRLRLVPPMMRADFAGPWDIRQVMTIRDAMWADDSLREAFVAENPAGLSAEDLAVVQSWRQRRAGTFFVLRHLKKYSLFIEDSTVYGVLGLASPLDEVVPFTPCSVKTVLLPFGGRIIYDSLMAPHNITFGRNIRAELERTYADAKERGAIITSLLPSGPLDAEAARGAARASNAKVLDAFRAHLFGAGLSPKVVERDLGHVAAFAEGYLGDRPEPRSLRESGPNDLSGYVTQVQAAAAVQDSQRRAMLTGLKRFVRFLRDTGRMDHHTAEDALEVLKDPR